MQCHLVKPAVGERIVTLSLYILVKRLANWERKSRNLLFETEARVRGRVTMNFLMFCFLASRPSDKTLRLFSARQVDPMLVTVRYASWGAEIPMLQTDEMMGTDAA